MAVLCHAVSVNFRFLSHSLTLLLSDYRLNDSSILLPNFSDTILFMGASALILLPFRLAGVFTGFTFTDIEDFGPLLTLFIGLLGVALIRGSPQAIASPPLLSLLVLLSLWPLLPNLGLFLMAHDFQSVRHSWPQVMVDDPKNWYGHVSPRFDSLFHLVTYLEAFSGAWMVVFLSLFFAVKSRLSTTQRRWCVGLMAVSVFIVLVAPGHL